MPSYVGASLRPVESEKFLLGRGTYVADLKFPEMLHAAFLRSAYAHARIKKIDASKALNSPGVVAVISADDTRKFVKPVSNEIPTPGLKPLTYGCFAQDKVTYVGEPVALVCARDFYSARDGLELIDVEYEPLPPVVDAESAMKPGTTLIYEDWGDNELFTLSFENGNVQAALDNSDHVFSERLYCHRLTGAPLETRGCIAQFEKSKGQLNVWSSTQFPHILKGFLSNSMGIPKDKVRVIAPDIGGAFGLKLGIWPEELATCAMSIILGKPVRWIEDRTDNLLADNHAREETCYLEFGVNNDLTITGIRLKGIADVGCAKYAPWSSASTALFSAATIPGVYRVENCAFEVHCIVTNKAPLGAYRGFGEAEGTFILERMVDIVARQMKADPAEIRMRNLIRPEDYPFVAAGGAEIDSGAHIEAMRQALQLFDYDYLKTKRNELRKEGKYIGIGIACGMKGTASNDYLFTNVMLSYEQTRLELVPDGTIRAFVGSTNQGQGVETTLAQIIADEVGTRFEDVKVIQGDTELTPYGFGNWASRGVVSGGGSAILAGRKMKSEIFQVASTMLEANPLDLELSSNNVSVRGTSKTISLKQISTYANEKLNKKLEVLERYDPMNGGGFSVDANGHANFCATYPYATHIALIEVDAETGRIKLVRYVVVYDSGRIVNPVLAEG